jgi:hypothetical protein
MAQSGYTQIQLYSSPTPGNTPAASNLTGGELAVNAADGKLFYKNTAGTTQVIADSAWAAYSSGVGIRGSGTNVVNTGTVQFANSNGVTFGLSGSTMTASVVAQSVASYNILSASGNTAGTLTSFSSGTVVLAGGNNVTLSQSSNTISINAAANLSVSAGTTSIATASVVFGAPNTNLISFGMTSNTITAVPLVQYYPLTKDYLPFINTNVVAEQNINTAYTGVSSVHLFALTDNLIVNRIEQPLSWVSADPVSVSMYGLRVYTSASTNNSGYALTVTQAYRNILYSKTGDTYSSVTFFDFPVIQRESLSFVSSSSTISTRVSFTVSGYATVSYPTATSSNGLLYSSSSAVTEKIFNIATSQVTQNGSTFGPTGVSLLFGGIARASPMLTSPYTLSSGTYLLLQGLVGSTSWANTNNYLTSVTTNHMDGCSVCFVSMSAGTAGNNITIADPAERRWGNVGSGSGGALGPVAFTDFNKFFTYTYSTTTGTGASTTYTFANGYGTFNIIASNTGSFATSVFDVVSLGSTYRVNTPLVTFRY